MPVAFQHAFADVPSFLRIKFRLNRDIVSSVFIRAICMADSEGIQVTPPSLSRWLVGVCTTRRRM